MQSVDHALFHRADIVARHRAADHLFVKLETGAARHRLDFQHDVAELAVAAGLLLVAAALGDRLADGLLVTDRGRMRFDVDAEAVAQPLQRDAQMHLALPPQHDVVGPRIVDHGQRRIFLVQPHQRLAELDVVLAIGGRQRHRQHRRRRLDLHQCRRRASCRSTSVSPVLIASSLPSATVSPASAEARLLSWAPLTARMPDTRPLSPEEDCSVAPSSRWPASIACKRQLAAVLQMHGLEHIGQRILASQARRVVLRSRRCRALHAAAPSSAAARRSRASAEPSSTGQINPSRNSRARSSNTASRGGWMSSSNCSISASS